ncbi:unnamed protein product [Victoria cruziana]
MSIYLSRSFPRSNSSFLLCSGNALQSSILRLREEMFLVDAGPGTPIICMQDEPTGNKVGSVDVVAGESLIKERILERFFIDLLVGSTDVVAGEPLLLLPQRFRQNRAWMELNKIWRTNQKVKGFLIEKVKGGYSVAIVGFITSLPFCSFNTQRIANDRFTIESIHPKRTKMLVLADSTKT